MTSSSIHPLTLGAEWRRQWGRRRTLWSLVLLLALPLVIVVAFRFGDGPVSGSTRLVDLAQLGAANFAVFIVYVSAQFLLVVLAAQFAGDTVPAEASWGTLRYLLVAPVPRVRLLTSKLIVAILTVTAAVLLMTGWALLVGRIAYGPAPLTNQVGGTLDWPVLGPRLVLVCGYLVVQLLQVVGLGFWFGTRTDAPLAAVGGTVLVTVLAGILGQIDALGDLRKVLPLHYDREWLTLLDDVVTWDDLRHGVLWSLLWFTITTALAYRRFLRKDILS